MSEQEPNHPEQESRPERVWRRLGERTIFESNLGHRIARRRGMTWRQVLDEDLGSENWRFVPEEPDDSTEIAGIENATRSQEANAEFMDRKQGAFDINAPDWDKVNAGYGMSRKGYIEVSDPTHNEEDQPEDE